jgi:hypothetical protein
VALVEATVKELEGGPVRKLGNLEKMVARPEQVGQQKEGADVTPTRSSVDVRELIRMGGRELFTRVPRP